MTAWAQVVSLLRGEVEKAQILSRSEELSDVVPLLQEPDPTNTMIVSPGSRILRVVVLTPDGWPTAVAQQSGYQDLDVARQVFY
tara:strand:+ start:1618 stop:1869 length:252 start_codon:yes stop_codon:yes gene_type:complete